ncbi:hypothetical protein [Xanthobacter autotrophicus]|uniref:hypothetical protein n=1 Tax=Xanthobacter autotrophicus TaxID=280 RepID=UPI003726A612
MLRDGDLKLFQQHYAIAAAGGVAAAEPPIVLAVEKGMFAQEVWRLSRSLQIAAVLGDAELKEAMAADLIMRKLGLVRAVSLDDAGAWQQAIAWSLEQPELPQPIEDYNRWQDRQQQVGEACRRLRARGYKIKIGAYGPQIEAASIKGICERIDGLIAHLGGVEVMMQVCRVTREQNLIHDGMWLFGDRVPGIWDFKRPATPGAWLFSLGLRHTSSGGKASKPEVAWRTIVELATDFAAANDCQRYSQYEEIDIHPSAFWRVLRDSLLWREIFGLAQVPRQVLPMLSEVLGELVAPDEQALLGFDLSEIFDELDRLLKSCADDNVMIHPREAIRASFPTLFSLASAKAGEVNRHYANPMVGGARNQESFIFFPYKTDSVVTLPSSLLRAAACELIFKRLWEKLPKKRAEQIVGKTFERAIKKACSGKTAHLLSEDKYQIGSDTYEIDVATRDGDNIVLFETKAKSLTAKARSGDMTAFYADYRDSYLAIVEQLARHERFLRDGTTPLTAPGEVCNNFRPIKVAVSPLSYGPVSDKVLANGLLRSLAGVQLTAANDDKDTIKMIKALNNAIEAIFSHLSVLAPKNGEGQMNLFAYLIDIFWLDLGQVLYVLDRSFAVWNAFEPLQFITFSTRDFWSEIAFADLQGVTKDRWRPI